MTTKKQTSDTNKCTYAQQQFLLREMRGLPGWRIRTPALPKTAKVLAAERAIKKHERVVAAHKRAESKLRERQRKKYADLETKAKEAIYFGTPEQARAAVAKLRALYEGCR